MMRRFPISRRSLACIVLVFGTTSAAQAQTTDQAWVARSNEHARILLDVMARLSPEGAARLGVAGYDGAISDFSEGHEGRAIAAYRDASGRLQRLADTETDPRVRQDLDILIDSASKSITGLDLWRRHAVPYSNVGEAVFFGIRSLLDDQVEAGRRQMALVRLRKYAGVESGFVPVATLAEQRIRSRFDTPNLLWPTKAEVERALADSASLLNEVPELFSKYGIDGYQDAFARLEKQIASYNDFVRREVLPRARSDFRLPHELYAFGLEQMGVDIPPDRLAATARDAFLAIQRDMQRVAVVVAGAKGWALTDYRDVIRELKREQLVASEILPHYQSRLKEIEAIIARERLVTLPTRPARIRLATNAETAANPAPHMQPPPLVGNTGQQGEFVLPLSVPATDGLAARTDDFTFAAASWTLTAHEARPGHELQFAGMLEAGVSTARAVFAFNSTNAEGWGLYAEHMLFPHMPPEGQLISLQHRLMRAGRAFLDPELQRGSITTDQAFAVLINDVVVSEPWARQELDRYTFRMPGQATTYFYGYLRLLELRADLEKALGPSFSPQAFHDFVLSQGLLPPALMRDAVLKSFVKN